MTASSIGKHAAGGTATDQPPVRSLHSPSGRARSVPGPHRRPFDIVAKTAGLPLRIGNALRPDDRGRPIFLISTMAMHTQNLQSDPRASLLVTQADTRRSPRSIQGHIGRQCTATATRGGARREKSLLAALREQQVLGRFRDFSFYRMDVVDVYYVGGFGVMGWVAAAEYNDAQPDPLADSTAEIIQHMNADHKDALILIARAFTAIDSQEAIMTAVDRLGFHVRLKTSEGMRGARIAFLREVRNPKEARNVLIEMVQQARQS